MKLVWSPAALDDLKSAIDYIEFDLDSPMAAKRFYESILDKAHLFANAPGSGITLKTTRDIDTGYRYIVCGNWILFFMIEENQALVVRLLYGRSDYMRTLFGDID
ncbi:MAG: type II toxin-antitoxin system RelE/ParE family toxin [Lancefieldella rimae]|mgnify:FL=1